MNTLDTLLDKNRTTIRNMQLWYLDNYSALQDMGYSKNDAIWYYITCQHPKIDDNEEYRGVDL